MVYRLRPDRDFTTEFRDVAKEQLHGAIALLEQTPDGLHPAIHDARKNLKKLRALYRLVAKDAPAFQKAENARLRDTARSLSVIRNADALIETCVYLRDNARSKDEKSALTRIVDIFAARRNWMAAAEGSLPGQVSQVVATLLEAANAVESVKFAGSHRKTGRMIGKAWRTTGRNATEVLAQCHGEASADTFHDLRKRTQDFRHYLSLLRDVWPTAMRARRNEAKALAAILGLIHDLSVLSGVVNDEPQLFTRNDDLARLLDAIIFHEQDARKRALVLAGKFFAEDPDREASRIELLWVHADG